MIAIAKPPKPECCQVGDTCTVTPLDCCCHAEPVFYTCEITGVPEGFQCDVTPEEAEKMYRQMMGAKH